MSRRQISAAQRREPERYRQGESTDEQIAHAAELAFEDEAIRLYGTPEPRDRHQRKLFEEWKARRQ